MQNFKLKRFEFPRCFHCSNTEFVIFKFSSKLLQLFFSVISHLKSIKVFQLGCLFRRAGARALAALGVIRQALFLPLFDLNKAIRINCVGKFFSFNFGLFFFFFEFFHE